MFMTRHDYRRRRVLRARRGLKGFARNNDYYRRRRRRKHDDKRATNDKLFFFGAVSAPCACRSPQGFSTLIWVTDPFEVEKKQYGGRLCFACAAVPKYGICAVIYVSSFSRAVTTTLLIDFTHE